MKESINPVEQSQDGDENMDTSQYDANIEGLIQSIEEKKKQLEEIRHEVRDFVIMVTTYWFNEEVDRTLASDPERTKKLGKEGLKPIKVEIEGLIASIPKLVDQQIEVGKCWAHSRKPPTEPFQSVRIDEGEYPNAFYTILRKIFWNISPIFTKYGYEMHRYSDQEYRSALTLPEDMEKTRDDLRKKYEVEFRDYSSLNDKLIWAKREKSNAEIKDLWSKV